MKTVLSPLSLACPVQTKHISKRVLYLACIWLARYGVAINDLVRMGEDIFDLLVILFVFKIDVGQFRVDIHQILDLVLANCLTH